MPESTSDPILDLLREQLDRASGERQAQTAAFERALGGLRWELRVLLGVAMVLFAAVSMARDGVFAKIGIPGVTIETHSAAAAAVEATTGSAAAAPSPAPELPAPAEAP